MTGQQVRNSDNFVLRLPDRACGQYGRILLICAVVFVIVTMGSKCEILIICTEAS